MSQISCVLGYFRRPLFVLFPDLTNEFGHNFGHLVHGMFAVWVLSCSTCEIRGHSDVGN
jgi:hypothetical protein